MSSCHVDVCGFAGGPHCVAECVAGLAPTTVQFTDVAGTLGLLCLSGLFSGLTLGLMSLDPQQLRIVIAGGTAFERKQAERILPIRERGNLLLCTLLLGNTLVNALIAILAASFTGGVIGGVISTVFILLFGEILPQSVCSRYGLAAGSKTVELVQFFMALLYVVAWPLSKALDKLLGDELGTLYNKKELKKLFLMQGSHSSAGREQRTSTTSGGGDDGGIKADEITYLTGALSLSEKTVEKIMTGLDDVFGLFPDERLDFELMRRIYNSGYTRIPVFRRPSRLSSSPASERRAQEPSRRLNPRASSRDLSPSVSRRSPAPSSDGAEPHGAKRRSATLELQVSCDAAGREGPGPPRGRRATVRVATGLRCDRPRCDRPRR